MMKNKLPGFDKLANLENFDPHAFISQDKSEQKVCNFVLSLSLIYNDLKDLNWAYYHYSESWNNEEVSSYNGQYFGMKWHIIKLHYSLLNELGKLIKNKSEYLKQSFFMKTIKKLDKNGKKDWKFIVDFAMENKIEESKWKNIIARIRNNISYHTNSEEIMKGYKIGFLDGNGNLKQDACISRGKNMESTRFYFSDVAIQGYFQYIEKIEKEELNNFFKETLDFSNKVNHTLYNIVTKFINDRGFAFRNAR